MSIGGCGARARLARVVPGERICAGGGGGAQAHYSQRAERDGSRVPLAKIPLRTSMTIFSRVGVSMSHQACEPVVGRVVRPGASRRGVWRLARRALYRNLCYLLGGAAAWGAWRCGRWTAGSLPWPCRVACGVPSHPRLERQAAQHTSAPGRRRGPGPRRSRSSAPPR